MTETIRTRVLWALLISILGVSFLLFLGGLYFFGAITYAWNFRASTAGHVTSVSDVSMKKGSVWQEVEVSYDVDGVAYHTTLDYSGVETGLTTGEGVEVFFDPADPKRATLRAPKSVWIPCAFGAAVLLLGVYSVSRVAKRYEPNKAVEETVAHDSARSSP